MGSMDIRDLRARIENINTLPTIPGVLKRLLGVIENPKVSLNEISNFISNDPALTTKVLKMVNSPVYGFPGRISSVNQAVILLGLSVVKGLLLGVSVFELMQKTMIGLWEHSLGCAIAARLIAEKKGLKEPEEASIDGLLHDIGKVLLILQLPEEYEKAMRDADIGDLSIYETERAHYGTTHSSVGSWMAQKWRFPQKLIDVIEYHHKPHLSKNAPVESAIVHLADILVRARGFGFAGDHTLMAVNPESWQMLDLSEADLRDILGALEESLEMTEELSL
jgi:putative nucleotidyltransferase with HDIG domain